MKTIKLSVMGFCLILLAACQNLALAPYDPQVRNLLVRTSVEVDYFWQTMQEQSAEKRSFSQFSKEYQAIALDLIVLLKLNQMRPDNQETIQQSQTLLDLWQQDIAQHQKNDSFKDFLLKRRVKEYQRVFAAMLTAEDAKDI